jgi:ABC-2 type transport system ATP-binding protein
LRCLAGIIPPTRGTVRICGVDLTADPVAAKRQLAFLSDEPRLFDYLTVRQHLEFVARIYRVADAARLGNELLAELELADKAEVLMLGVRAAAAADITAAAAVLRGTTMALAGQQLAVVVPHLHRELVRRVSRIRKVLSLETVQFQ